MMSRYTAFGSKPSKTVLLTHLHDGTQRATLTSAQLFSTNRNERPGHLVQGLQPSLQAAQFIWGGHRSLTRRTYTTPRYDFVYFWEVREVTPFPVSGQLLALWTAKLGSHGPHTNTNKSYLTGLKLLHIDVGFSTEPFCNHHLQLV